MLWGRMLIVRMMLLIVATTGTAYAQGVAEPGSPPKTATSSQAPPPAEPDMLRPEDYPAKVFQKKPAKNIRLHPQDDWVRENKADLLQKIGLGADFAGHYTMIYVGCGTACLGVRMVDLKNGEVFKFPASGEYQLDLNFSVQSRLMDAMWIEDSSCVQVSYEWTGRSFKKLRERRTALGEHAELCSFNPTPLETTPSWDPENGWRP